MSREFEVEWRVRVTADSHEEAAKEARAAMIDPSRTTARLEVRELTATGVGRELTPTILEVQDPDES